MILTYSAAQKKREKARPLFLGQGHRKKPRLLSARCHSPSPCFKRSCSLTLFTFLQQFSNLRLDGAGSVTKFHAISGVEAPCERRNRFLPLSNGIVFLKQASISIRREHLAWATLWAAQHASE
jgi:hypothetical protein